MIGKLRGYIDSLRQDSLILDVQGVGYHVFVSTRTLDSLHMEKEQVSLWIETHVREDQFHLYGFLSEAEQECFQLLTTVQGVGNKMGLAILSVFSAQDVSHMILAQDQAGFTRVSGVGKRIAERIVTELKNRIPAFGSTMPPLTQRKTATTSQSEKDSNNQQHLLLQDSVSALEQLGYDKTRAHKAVYQAMQEGLDNVESVIKTALKNLS